MKVRYLGEGCKSPVGRFAKDGVYDLPDALAIEFSKRPDFELVVDCSGKAQQEYVEKITKNTKKGEQI
jgi:hypothetical protein